MVQVKTVFFRFIRQMSTWLTAESAESAEMYHK